MWYRLFNSQKEELARKAKTDVLSWMEYNFKYNSGMYCNCSKAFLDMDKDEDVEAHFKGECNNG